MAERLFKLVSDFKPTGDQPEAIDAIANGLAKGANRLVLQGVTGSGKTFTMANVIARWNRPTLILSHNKTLAAQLFAELRQFFPENAVEYFISYYDYYQPEAYIPQTDTYIEKDASINEEIERYRLAATNALIARRDVIVVASVSCIYGLGESTEYRNLAVGFKQGECCGRGSLVDRLIAAQYVRNDFDYSPTPPARSACAATWWTSSPPTRRTASAWSSSATRLTPSASSPCPTSSPASPCPPRSSRPQSSS